MSVVKYVTDTKLDSVKRGPFKVKERSITRPTNYVLLFLGIPGTEIEVHNDDMRSWPGFDEKDLEDKKFEQFKLRMPAKPTQGVSRQCRIIMEKFNLSTFEEIGLEHVLGKRIRVFWKGFSEKVPSTWELGTVKAHEGRGQFWVEYDEMRDENDTPFFLEDLLFGRPPQWNFAPDLDPNG